jgi:hypothetical protein
MRNAIFVMLGLLVGFGIVQYGIWTTNSKLPVVAQIQSQTTTENLKENLVIDPVEITAPEATASQTEENLEGDDALLSQALEKIQSAEAASNSLSSDSEASLLEEIEREQSAQINLESVQNKSESEEPTEISISR